MTDVYYVTPFACFAFVTFIRVEDRGPPSPRNGELAESRRLFFVASMRDIISTTFIKVTNEGRRGTARPTARPRHAAPP